MADTSRIAKELNSLGGGAAIFSKPKTHPENSHGFQQLAKSGVAPQQRRGRLFYNPDSSQAVYEPQRHHDPASGSSLS